MLRVAIKANAGMGTWARHHAVLGTAYFMVYGIGALMVLGLVAGAALGIGVIISVAVGMAVTKALMLVGLSTAWQMPVFSGVFLVVFVYIVGGALAAYEEAKA